MLKKKNNFLIFRNSFNAIGSYSYGPISEIIYETPRLNELSTQFMWDFSNSYNDKKGIAYVDIRMVKNKLNDKDRIFTAVIILLLDNSIMHYEGYINSNDFIKIQWVKNIKVQRKNIQDFIYNKWKKFKKKLI